MRRTERSEPKGRGVLGRIMRRFAAERGAVSPIMAVLLIPIIGVLGLGTETAGWYFTQRSAQNAADTAALAAATNACTTTTPSCGLTYDKEAKAAAQGYGFQDGVSNTTVTPAYPVACPDGTTTCYRVTITKTLPIYLTRIVGFNGSGALGSGRGQLIQAVAVASSRLNKGFCMLALGHGASTSSTLITMNGNNDLGGCDIFSNGSEKCNGSGFDIATATYADDPVKSSQACGTKEYAKAAQLADPYASISNVTNIPSSTTGCVAGGTITAPVTLDASSSARCYTSSLTINGTGAVTVTTPSSGGTLKFYNGASLTLGSGVTLSGSNLAIVFTGAAGNNAPGFINGGTYDFSAPTSGAWSGVALYQDSRMTKGTSITYSGNSPKLNISGLIYIPYVNFTVKGAINKHTGGFSCMSVVADQLTISGGSFFANTTSECRQAGLTLPTSQSLLTRQALVQ